MKDLSKLPIDKQMVILKEAQSKEVHKWTDREIEKLKLYMKEGITPKIINEYHVLPGRSLASIEKQCSKLRNS